MAKKCPLCGNKMGGLIKFKVTDGEICGICSNLCPSYQTSNIQEMQLYMNKNQERVNCFTKTSVLKSLLSECVMIDDTHKLFYMVKNEKSSPNSVYSFDEIEGYEFEEVGGKTVTKNKGGVGRAIVGGALFGGVGAVVGAATSKTETKKVGATNVLKVHLNMPAGRKTLVLTSPPIGFTPFLDRCIDSQPDANIETTPFLSDADEIKKYKMLFDEGIISQEEFDAKKKQLLKI